MSELVAGLELHKGSYGELIIFRGTRGATVDHTEKGRIGPAQRDLNPQCIAKKCRGGIREENRDWKDCMEHANRGMIASLRPECGGKDTDISLISPGFTDLIPLPRISKLPTSAIPDLDALFAVTHFTWSVIYSTKDPQTDQKNTCDPILASSYLYGFPWPTKKNPLLKELYILTQSPQP
ncbi:hypothetical protein CLF_108677 [Clonorchis sinensis]|uniref:Uncharacterized protein n=1 Tax=Clonorchis sinensis TaxID=79923 RepID=G7YIE1_CLOSI|nr:hypothetical protein CLF_108677 [Clonorchis sinensis]